MRMGLFILLLKKLCEIYKYEMSRKSELKNPYSEQKTCTIRHKIAQV